MAKRLFYRIKEVAHQLGEPVSTVRYWETVFPQVSPHISPKGVRQYTERDIETLRTIQLLLREKGMTIEGANAQLRVRQSSSSRVPIRCSAYGRSVSSSMSCVRHSANRPSP